MYAIRSYYALDQYCYFVAGVVGEMLTQLFCAASADCARQQASMSRLAVAFGQGLQMTNILKDVWEDRARGVCWLPRALCAEVGLDLANLTGAADEPAFGQALERLIAIANGHLQDALDYSLLIPASEQGMRQFCLVITSYSIHYTKLYDPLIAPDPTNHKKRTLD